MAWVFLHEVCACLALHREPELKQSKIIAWYKLVFFNPGSAEPRDSSNYWLGSLRILKLAQISIYRYSTAKRINVSKLRNLKKIEKHWYTHLHVHGCLKMVTSSWCKLSQFIWQQIILFCKQICESHQFFWQKANRWH